MSNTFMKKGLRGFTLIELLVVIAIIGLLSTVIAGPIQTARKKGRDAKKIADIKGIQSALSQYADDNNGAYPANITAAPFIAPNYLPVAPANAAAATPASEKYMYVTYADANGKIVGYHLGVKLEVNNPALQGDADCHGTGCNAVTGALTSNWSAGAAAANAGNPGFSAAALAANVAAPTADFSGAGMNEALGNTCTAALTNCIFDVTESSN